MSAGNKSVGSGFPFLIFLLPTHSFASYILIFAIDFSIHLLFVQIQLLVL